MTYYVMIFLAGVAGSFHCAGMCGGFACAIGRDPRGHNATVQRHLIYNIGRITTYCFLGGMFGYLGAHIIHLWEGSPLGIAQRALAAVSGALMVFIGLQFLGYLKRSTYAVGGFGLQSVSPALRALIKEPRHAAALSFGVINGFLPCPLVYAFAAQAAASGGPLPGLLIMVAFGLGTFPTMLLMGGMGHWLRSDTGRASTQKIKANVGRTGATAIQRDWRVHSVRIAGAFIVLLGVVTFARGILPFAGHGLLH